MTEKALKEMSGRELVAYYNQLTGENVKRFSSPEAGRKRIAAALAARAVESPPATPRIVRLSSRATGSAAMRGEEAEGKKSDFGFTHAMPVQGGKSVLQKQSKRRQVFEKLVELSGEPLQHVAVADLDKAMGFSTRAHLTKLRHEKHITTCKLKGQQS